MIDYSKLVDEAMHLIVYKVLKNVAKEGLPDDHHFFISFRSKHPSVKMSDKLRNKYPNEMTIVLQFQYEKLEVSASGFSVVLSFSGVKEPLFIPFAAITTFADPSTQFGLQFKASYEETPSTEISIDEDFLSEETKPSKSSKKKTTRSAKTTPNKSTSARRKTDNVIPFNLPS